MANVPTAKASFTAHWVFCNFAKNLTLQTDVPPSIDSKNCLFCVDRLRSETKMAENLD